MVGSWAGSFGFVGRIHYRAQTVLFFSSYSKINRLFDVQTILGPTERETKTQLGRKKNQMTGGFLPPCPSRRVPNCLVTVGGGSPPRKTAPGPDSYWSNGDWPAMSPCALPVEKRGRKIGVTVVSYALRDHILLLSQLGERDR